MFETDQQFEDEIRRLARLLWPSAEFGGAQIVDDRERDAIFETDEFIHCIECTVSRRKDKAVQDITKLESLIRKLTPKHPTKFLKAWFITLNEPTADQRSVIKTHQKGIVACSYDQFKAKLVDGRAYLASRNDYPFGSVRDPDTGDTNFALKYVPIDVLDTEGNTHNVSALAELLASGTRIILTGDYGSGKSSTARQVFVELARDFCNGKTARFPLLLNLRDHHGQTDPIEAIERHARCVGFGATSTLVRGWRAGYCTLILDGFDEIASAGWAGITKRLRDLRYRSMELIRHFVRDTPSPCGVLITGRAHFFDSEHELSTALAADSKCLRFQLADFSGSQLATFLENAGWDGNIPDWLPTRPLLLAYLAGRNLLPAPTADYSGISPQAGWHELLERISKRESEIEAGIDASTVRHLIEAIATRARSSADGIGPISADAIIDVFRKVCGYQPDDRGAVLLQRLPGLGGTSSEDGSRVFVDKDFAEAARSGDVFRFIQSPYSTELCPENWQASLLNLGATIAAYRCQLHGYDKGKISSAIVSATGNRGSDNLLADLVLVLTQMPANYEGPRVYLKEVFVNDLSLDDALVDLSKLEFQDSVIARLELGAETKPEMLPVFLRCHFARVDGRTGDHDLPMERFCECSFDEFEHSSKTTNGILALSLPLSTKVMLTILKKLFIQSGCGRRESALFRGLEPRAKELVPELLDLLRRHSFITKTKHGAETVWLPTKTRDARSRALTILSAPHSSADPLIEACSITFGEDA